MTLARCDISLPQSGLRASSGRIRKRDRWCGMFASTGSNKIYLLWNGGWSCDVLRECQLTRPEPVAQPSGIPS